MVEFKLKTVSKAGIAGAIAKAETYRYLNEPGETESICRDVLATEPDNQAALRLLGLAIADRFGGGAEDRVAEAESLFQKLTDTYERLYYTGLLHERRAKAQLHAGQPLRVLVPLFEKAMACFEDAEKIRPANNDDAILRWNRCARLIQSLPAEEAAREPSLEVADGIPVV